MIDFQLLFVIGSKYALFQYITFFWIGQDLNP